MTVGERLKKYRAAKKLTQEQLAEKIGIAHNTYARYESDIRKPNTENAIKLAVFFGISMNELIDGYYDQNSSFTSQPYGKIIGDGKENYVRIPVLGRIPAGIPIEAIQDVEDWEDFSLDESSSMYQYFGLKIKGDSMEPEYRDGDTVIFQQQERCNSGDDCAVMVNGDDATFKRVRLHEHGMTLQPLNSKYEPRYFTAQEVESFPVKILGVVVEIRRKMRK